MKSILDPGQDAVLRRFARAGTLLAFDYDGTLAPIVANPAEARMRPATAELLKRVARRLPTAVITGRARHDVLGFLSGVPLVEVVGNHGFEAAGLAPLRHVKQVASWRAQLARDLAGLEGVELEDKRYSLSIHYRRSPDRAAAETLRRLASALEGSRTVPGKQVLSVVPADAPTKGSALVRLCSRLAAPQAIFVGDDDTDEDVFALRREDILGIRVAPGSHSLARYALRDQTEVDTLLDRIAALDRETSVPTAGRLSPAAR